MQNTTLDYYDKNADAFVDQTQTVDFSSVQTAFLSCMKSGGKILDFGCGSGRDARSFLEKGYLVDAADGSPEVARRASQYIGIPVRCMLFQELSAENEYDGIWACASILHLSKAELTDVFEKMLKALKSDGILYTSFKYGTKEEVRGGRYFTDFTEETFADFIADMPQLTLEDQWISSDVRPGRGGEKWLNVILRKQNTI